MRQSDQTVPGGTGLAELIRTGDEAWERGDRAAAHEAYRAAQQLDGNDPQVLSRLGLTLTIVAKDEYKGVAFCEEALRRGAADADALFRLATVYETTFAMLFQETIRFVALDVTVTPVGAATRCAGATGE